jgi:hypothetical protein
MLRELLKEIFTFSKEKKMNLRQQFIKRDVRQSEFVDIVTFGEVMSENKMEVQSLILIISIVGKRRSETN